MNARSYKLIFALLSISVLSILALQAYWLRSFYLQKLDQFHISVYDAMEQVGDKLRERATISAVKDEVFVRTKSPFKMKNPSVPIVTDHTVRLNKNGQVIKKSIIATQKSPDGEIVTSFDSVYVVSGPGPHAVISSMSKSENGAMVQSSVRVMHHNEKSRQDLQILDLDSARSVLAKKMKKTSKLIHHIVNDKEIGPLMDKLLIEIKSMDTEIQNPDTLKKLISQVLENKGIFLPFEFSLTENLRTRGGVVASSKGYDSLQNAFVSDLGLSNILENQRMLSLQFPGKSDHVLAGMKGTFWLSFVFSLVILTLFYVTLRLIQKQKKISDLKADFVNNMTHELKTPIATISLALDAMNNPEVRDNPYRIYEYNRILKEENNKLNKHVERVLQISQLEKGNIQLQKIEVDLVFLMNRAINNFALRIKESGAEVHCLSSALSVMINADLTHLSSVFSNLIDNALKYSGNHCTLKIEILERAKEVLIVFEDNGIGFDPSQREKIFEKFYRVQGGDLHEVKGFGLGLSYCRNIVEMHGGRIEAEGNPGKGSTFTILLPKDAN